MTGASATVSRRPKPSRASDGKRRKHRYRDSPPVSACRDTGPLISAALLRDQRANERSCIGKACSCSQALEAVPDGVRMRWATPRQPCGCDPAHPRAHVEPDVAALWTPPVREQVAREPSRPATDLDHMPSFGESTIGGQPRQRWRLEDPLGVLKPPDAVINAGRLTRGQALGSRTGPAPVRPLTHRAPLELAEPMPARAARDGGDSAWAPTGAGHRGPSTV